MMLVLVTGNILAGATAISNFVRYDNSFFPFHFLHAACARTPLLALRSASSTSGQFAVSISEYHTAGLCPALVALTAYGVAQVVLISQI
jgi:hypothetical protein